MTIFTELDLVQATERGLESKDLWQQLEWLKAGPHSVKLIRPCTLGDGILPPPSPEEAEFLAQEGLSALAQGRGLAFIPASGAASRMFASWARALHSGLTHVKQFKEAAAAGDTDAQAALLLWDEFPKFAFASEAEKYWRASGKSWESVRNSEDLGFLLKTLLEKDGLGFLEKPKAHIPFHRYSDVSLQESYSSLSRTAFEEQILEALALWGNSESTVRLHFTVSAEHRELFTSAWKKFQQAWGPKAEKIELEFSEQSPRTDTLAGDGQGGPFRDKKGRLVFRPGGHGSLLTNIEATQGDLLFLRNIDNIAHENRRTGGRFLRLALAGRLVQLQKSAARHLELVMEGNESTLDEALAFIANFGRIPRPNLSPIEMKSWVLTALQRPIRICGMVRNQGEPGGGPFWVQDAEGQITPQIIEAAQVKTKDSRQAEIFAASTHFNPVDCVLGLKDLKGNPYPLRDFTDPSMYLVSTKTQQGKPLQALEWPGLWNGSMAGWNTVFAEIPLSMFTPVKTALDLLRPEHQ
jgi:hypothetical protein